MEISIGDILAIIGTFITLCFGTFKIYQNYKTKILQSEKYLKEEFKHLLDRRDEKMSNEFRNTKFSLKKLNDSFLLKMKEWHRKYMNICYEQWKHGQKSLISEDYRKEFHAKIEDAMKYPSHRELWEKYTKFECYGTKKESEKFRRLIDGFIQKSKRAR